MIVEMQRKNMQWLKMSFGIIGLMLLLLACEKDEADYTVTVDEALVEYFELFIAEGAVRGVEVDLSGISGYIEQIERVNVAGNCTITSEGRREIRLDEVFWRSSTPTNREIVVFHELGHCYLDRGHDDTFNDETNRCNSIMNSGRAPCSFNYFGPLRAAYLDELFSN